jgi:hypothetical protein
MRYKETACARLHNRGRATVAVMNCGVSTERLLSTTRDTEVTHNYEFSYVFVSFYKLTFRKLFLPSLADKIQYKVA